MDEVPNDRRWIRLVDSTLVEAIGPVTELIQTLDGMIAEHESQLIELRNARRKALRVTHALDDKAPSRPGRKPGNPGAAGTVKHYGAARDAKRERVRAFVTSQGIAEDVTGAAVFDGVNENGHPPISRGMVYDLLRDLRDDGTLRLDRTGMGGQSIYRLVGEAVE